MRVRGEAIAHYYCHCDDCQLVHGGAYVPRIMYPLENVELVEGDIVTWALRTLPRTRCAKCGTFLFAEMESFGIRGLNAALAPAGFFKPLFHVQCQYAVRPVKDDLPHYKAFPRRFGGTDELVTW